MRTLIVLAMVVALSGCTAAHLNCTPPGGIVQAPVGVGPASLIAAGIGTALRAGRMGACSAHAPATAAAPRSGS